MRKTTQKQKEVKEGLPEVGSPEMDKYTQEQLNEVFEHRLWTNPHPEALTDEDIKQGLLLMAQSKEIQKVFIALRNQLTQGIIKASHKPMTQQNVNLIERLGVKHEFVNRLLDRIENMWRNRQRQSKEVDNLSDE